MHKAFVVAVVCTLLAAIQVTGTCRNEINQWLWLQTAFSRAEMESKFKEHSVVPDVLDDVPPQLAEVKYVLVNLLTYCGIVDN